jgi:hypothetical protein
MVAPNIAKTCWILKGIHCPNGGLSAGPYFTKLDGWFAIRELLEPVHTKNLGSWYKQQAGGDDDLQEVSPSYREFKEHGKCIVA